MQQTESTPGTAPRRRGPAPLSAARAAALALALAAGNAAAQQAPIRIGALLPISGPGAYFGVQDRQGFEVALDVLKDGVAGRKFEVVYEDSQCSPLVATQAVKRLIENNRPDVLVGEECSDASLAILPIATQAEIPLINAGSSTFKLTSQGSKWVFRIMPDELMQGESIAKNAFERLKARKAVLLHENTNAGIGNAAAFSKNFTSLGGEIVQRIGFDRTVNDFTPIATRVAGLGPVDVIPTYTLEGQGVRITQALEQARVVRGGGGKAIQMGTIWLPAGFDEKAGKGAEGYVRIVQFNPDDPSAPAQAFVRAYRARFGADKTPSHISAHGYDQVMLIADAVRRGAKDAKTLRDRLAETRSFQGATGTVTFDAAGQNVNPSTIHYVQTGADLKWKALDWR